MTILLMFRFGTFDNFKHYYPHFIPVHLKSYFPKAVSCNRFVELESRVFFKMMFFLLLRALSQYTGIKANMRNRLTPLWDKIMLRKRYIVEYINKCSRQQKIGTHKAPLTEQFHHESHFGIGSLLFL